MFHLLVKTVKESNPLNSFPKTHLVCEDGVGALRPREPQPVQSLQLVRMEGPPTLVKVSRLLIQFPPQQGFLRGINFLLVFSKFLLPVHISSSFVINDRWTLNVKK